MAFHPDKHEESFPFIVSSMYKVGTTACYLLKKVGTTTEMEVAQFIGIRVHLFKRTPSTKESWKFTLKKPEVTSVCVPNLS